MPGFVGAVQVIVITGSGVFNVGDVFKLHPVSSSKVFSGAGSFNTGDHISVTNHYSATNTYDNDTLDQGIIFTL